MKRKPLAGLAAALLLTLFTIGSEAAPKGHDEDTDTRMIDARVVEVTDARISVVARTGVEHVIATDAADTHVTLRGKRVELKKLRVGDVVTVDLDPSSQMKFARRIVIGEQSGDTLASARD